MRTTIELPDDLLRAARQRAALEGLSLKEFFIAAVRRQIEPSARKGRRQLPVIGGAEGPPIPDLTREQIDEALLG